MSEDNSATVDARRVEELLNRVLSEAGGVVAIDRAGIKPIIRGDRKGLLKLGAALVQFAMEVSSEDIGNQAHTRSRENLFDPSSRVKTVHMVLDELPNCSQGSTRSNTFLRLTNSLWGIRRK